MFTSSVQQNAWLRIRSFAELQVTHLCAFLEKIFFHSLLIHDFEFFFFEGKG